MCGLDTYKTTKTKFDGLYTHKINQNENGWFLYV